MSKPESGKWPRIRLICQACSAEPSGGDPFPHQCPNRGDPGSEDFDHLLLRRLESHSGTAPAQTEDAHPIFDEEENPFLRYRGLLLSYRTAREHAVTDETWTGWVRELDEAVVRVDGRGFRRTPFEVRPGLGKAGASRVWVKDESGNVGGSHKARHLFGVLLHLRLARHLGAAVAERPLVVASCGNAALGAAVVARAAGRALSVFVPEDANPSILERLRELEARIEVCPRRPGESGDPTYLRFREAVDGGALPFSVQARENGLVLEGGLLIGYEMAETLAARDESLDHLFVQVGGGTLATSVLIGLRETVGLGLLKKMPRIHAVQTAGTAPLARAFDLLVRTEAEKGSLEAALRSAAHHRSRFMWAWESPTPSVAYGILDDETYDWLPLVRNMGETGGRPVVVTENELVAAHAEGNDPDRGGGPTPVCATGTAGLAGLRKVRSEAGAASDAGLGRPESSALLFTGLNRV